MARYDDIKQNKAAAEAVKPRERKARVTLRERINTAEKRGPIDMPFAILVVIILTIGVVMVLSSSFASAYYSSGTGHNATYFFTRQLVFAVGGVVAMLLVSVVPAEWFRKYCGILLLGTVIALVLVLIPGIGQVRNGARRWIGIGDIFTVQPSEIAKIAIILFSAHLACVYKDKMHTIKYGTLPFLILIGLLCGLVLLERHYSGTIIIGLLGIIMMFTAGSNLFILIAMALVGGGAILGMILITGYSSARVSAWLDPFSDLLGDGWQIVQSQYSIGSGGLLGLGLGQSRQKYLYLPESYNDYIFSIVCEELGLIGALLVIALFVLLIVRGYWLAMHARDRFGSLTIVGITSLVAVQTMLNIAVVTNSIPATGISLPFFSYGGTALLIQMAEMGVILSISRDIPLRKPRKTEKEKTE